MNVLKDFFKKHIYKYLKGEFKLQIERESQQNFIISYSFCYQSLILYVLVMHFLKDHTV